VRWRCHDLEKQGDEGAREEDGEFRARPQPVRVNGPRELERTKALDLSIAVVMLATGFPWPIFIWVRGAGKGLPAWCGTLAWS
jgi:hypothetical protein